eukprot:332216-Pelagomonas_calceolata.AAC.4
MTRGKRTHSMGGDAQQHDHGQGNAHALDGKGAQHEGDAWHGQWKATASGKQPQGIHRCVHRTMRQRALEIHRRNPGVTS